MKSEKRKIPQQHEPNQSNISQKQNDCEEHVFQLFTIRFSLFTKIAAAQPNLESL